jgi:hypothetical protein
VINKRKDPQMSDLHPDDLDLVERRLRESRPVATDSALTRARLTAMPDEPSPRRVTTSGRRRTRVAIAGMLAGGVLMSGGGAALGISGINDNGSPAAAQYVQPTTSTNEVLGTQTTPSTETETPTTETEDPGTGAGDPGTETTAPDVINEAQPARQVQATSAEKELPFTGLAAIPIIVSGIALLVAGAVLRRRSATV